MRQARRSDETRGGTGGRRGERRKVEGRRRREEWV